MRGLIDGSLDIYSYTALKTESRTVYNCGVTNDMKYFRFLWGVECQ